MLKLLGVGWTAWQLAGERFGPVGGFVSAVAIAADYVVLLRWLRDSHPGPAKRLEW